MNRILASPGDLRLRCARLPITHAEGIMSTPPRILVTDFDSTITRQDFYDLVRKKWPIPPEDDPWERYTRGERTHFQALAEIFSRIRTSEPELMALVSQMEIAPGLAEAVARLRTAGWEIEVASAGCAWYIERLLAGADVALTVHASPGEFSPATGLQMRLPEASAFCCEADGINKAAVVRAALGRSPWVAFAGDGRPDLAPALLVPPERRFARGWLAGALAERNEPYHPFEVWTEIADLLAP